VTLVTIDFVRFELLKGSADTIKYTGKEKLIHEITDTILPITPYVYELVSELIKQYEIDGTALDITDFILGAFLIQYSPNLCLMTRDTTDFRQNIFSLPHIVNIPHNKGIFTYGIYQYLKK
jgi:predicted nucleic acid-binding protein